MGHKQTRSSKTNSLCFSNICICLLSCCFTHWSLWQIINYVYIASSAYLWICFLYRSAVLGIHWQFLHIMLLILSHFYCTQCEHITREHLKLHFFVWKAETSQSNIIWYTHTLLKNNFTLSTVLLKMLPNQPPPPSLSLASLQSISLHWGHWGPNSLTMKNILVELCLHNRASTIGPAVKIFISGRLGDGRYRCEGVIF